MMRMNPLQSFSRRLRNAYADRGQLEQRMAIAYGWLLLGMLLILTALAVHNALRHGTEHQALGAKVAILGSLVGLAIAVVLMLRGKFRSIADPLCWILSGLHIMGGTLACAQGDGIRFLTIYGLFVISRSWAPASSTGCGRSWRFPLWRSRRFRCFQLPSCIGMP